MELKNWGLVAGAVVGLSLAGYALLGAQTDEEQILLQLDRLEEALRLDGETTNPLVLRGRFNERFEEVFAEDVTYRIPELSSPGKGRRSLVDLATRSSMTFRTLEVDLQNRDVELTGSATGADVGALAVLRATRGNHREHDERNVRFSFVNGKAGWQIASVRVYPRDEPSE